MKGESNQQNVLRPVHLSFYRYANMDYLAFSSILGIVLTALLFSYDIPCQWCKKFFRRMNENFPLAMQIDRTKVKDIRFAIPKKHYRVHGGEPGVRGGDGPVDAGRLPGAAGGGRCVADCLA